MTTQEFLSRLAGLTDDIRSVLCQVDVALARRHFRVGLVSPRRRGADGNPYRTAGHSRAAVTARTYEMLEVLGTDVADLLAAPGVAGAPDLARHAVVNEDDALRGMLADAVQAGGGAAGPVSVPSGTAGKPKDGTRWVPSPSADRRVRNRDGAAYRGRKR